MLQVKKPPVRFPGIGLIDECQGGLHKSLPAGRFIVQVGAILKKIGGKAIVGVVRPEACNDADGYGFEFQLKLKPVIAAHIGEPGVDLPPEQQGCSFAEVIADGKVIDL